MKRETLKEVIIETMVEYGIEETDNVIHSDFADSVVEKIDDEEPDLLENETEELFDETYDEGAEEEEESPGSLFDETSLDHDED